jgi:hypothetical protein
MSEAKGGEGKDDDYYNDAKGSSGGGGGGGGERRDENELLMIVAAKAENEIFGGNSELMLWVNEHCDEWAEAVAGEEDGSGSPIKLMARWKSLHMEYLAIMESWLMKIVADQNATLEDFMEDVRRAMDGGSGFLFEDENYSDFVKTVMAMEDFEQFHALMMKWSKLNSMSPVPRGHK